MPVPTSLLLIGGGHAHLFVLEALRQHRQQSRDKFDITLITRDLQTPYSGMLPGLIAGHYQAHECHIDLRPLAQAAGVKLIHAQVDRLDLVSNQVSMRQHALKFDLLSIDIGSTPPLAPVKGAATQAISVKPIDEFLQRWLEIEPRLRSAEAAQVVMVGGGAGGIEVILALKYRFDRDARKAASMRWMLITRGELLVGYPKRAVRLMQRRLQAAGIELRIHTSVLAVEPNQLVFPDGGRQSFDALIWATGAAPQPWLAQSGLQCIDGGFVQINAQLQSVSHAHIFAAGDIATDPERRRPKAGVFAVRQGPVLAQNLLRYLEQKPLLTYQPQTDYLSLLSTGAQHAIASWYGLVLEGDWAWRWKDSIDRRFMRRFQILDSNDQIDATN